MQIEIEIPSHILFEDIQSYANEIAGLTLKEEFASNEIRTIKVIGYNPEDFYNLGLLLGSKFGIKQ